MDFTNIYLTLQKVRLDKTFAELGDDYGVSESTASRMFSKSVDPISARIKEFIKWIPNDIVKRCLPVPFRARYSKMSPIIDYLEIEIQKSKHPIKHAIFYLFALTPRISADVNNPLLEKNSATIIASTSGRLSD